MNEHKVCVAICNYNHSRFLDEAIKSICAQSYDNLDIVVVDDGSEDEVIVSDVVTKIHDKRIRYIPLGKNFGKWHALNTAFSTTDAILCTSHDADDVSLSWRIQAQVETLMQTNTCHNLCGFVSAWSEEEVESYKKLLANVPENYKHASGQEVISTIAQGFQHPGINHFFTGNFETAGVSALFLKWAWSTGFRFNPPRLGLRVLVSEDSDFNLRISLGLKSTSILLETPYIYRRGTSTNKELQ